MMNKSKVFGSKAATSGFTLIELMIVVIVLAVLAAIAYPSYQQHLLKTRRAVVKADMVEYAQRAERYHSVNNTYAGFALPAEESPREGGVIRYQLGFEGDGSTFTVTATPQGEQAKDACGTLTVDQANRKTSSTGELADCW
ncbi:type IV pilin protein [Stenotrophomonas sp. PFBMAA-4]|uniref:type IV pilin protein n=1 Tax=Stenotrophomonas sp. PFBMAA-4 TaxID=3043301 RepID=UPI0024B59366|nr:type IV pilin protein [Stenotrophomonas sp. PFBMAA-4]MDI9274886.1 type IV pilin protein [Stenotrophomonas sp. PFBMAA-4]